MALDIELLLLGELACVDGSRNIISPIAQHGQSVNIDVIIYEDNGCLGLFDEADDVGVCVEDLSVVENAFYWWKGGTDEEIDLILQVLYLCVLFCYMLFQCHNTGIDYISSEQILL